MFEIIFYNIKKEQFNNFNGIVLSMYFQIKNEQMLESKITRQWRSGTKLEFMER